MENFHKYVKILAIIHTPTHVHTHIHTYTHIYTAHAHTCI